MKAIADTLAADPLSVDALRYLASPAGQDLLSRAAAQTDDEFSLQQALRRDFPPAWCRAALALVLLRRAAAPKFAAAGSMFFDRQGLEMASGDMVARHRARRFKGAGLVLDLCCGVGGDLLALAEHAAVLAVDQDRRRLEMARLNVSVLERPRVSFVAADVGGLRLRGDAVFVDPARRLPGGRRLRAAESYSPPLSWVDEVRRQVPATAVKVSPAIDGAEIPPGCEAEWVSWRGQCREAGLYFGPLATAGRRATLLPSGATLVNTLVAGSVPVEAPGPFVHDPDPAVVGAHLVEALARELGAWRLDPRLAYLCSRDGQRSPFASVFRVITWVPFQLKRLRQLLHGEGFLPVEIKKRAIAMTPEELRSRLGVRTGQRPVTLVCMRVGEKPLVAICEKLPG